MKKILTTFIISIITICMYSQSVECKGFSPQTVRPGDQAVYTFSLKNLGANINLQDIPIPDGLAYVGQNSSNSFSMGTGMGTVRETSIHLIFIAQKDGVYEIPEWSFSSDKKVYKVPSSKLTVDSNAPSQPIHNSNLGYSQGFQQSPFGASRRSQSARNQSTDTVRIEDFVKLDLRIKSEKIYVGQSIPCELILTVDGKLAQYGYSISQLMPAIKNADSFSCAGFAKNPSIDKSNGKITVVFSTVITPIKAGDTDLNFEVSGEATSQPSIDDLFNMDIFDRFTSMGGRSVSFTIPLKDKNIKVLSLPKEGMPKNFTGAIGKFSLENVSIDTDSLSVGEPCTLTAKVLGMGNFDRIGSPVFEDNGDWKTYKPKSTFVDEGNGGGYLGIKTFSYIMVPTKPDLMKTPILEFNYFDTNSGKYVELKSNPISVSVAPTKSFAKRIENKKEDGNADPLGYLSVQTKTTHASKGFFESIYFMIFQIVILCGFGWFIYYKVSQNRLLNDPIYAKNYYAGKSTKKYLNMARSDALNGNAKEFFANAKLAIQYALSINSNLQALAITKHDAYEILSDRSIDLQSEITLYFDGSDAIEFAGYSPSKDEVKDLNSKLEKICITLLK